MSVRFIAIRFIEGKIVPRGELLHCKSAEFSEDIKIFQLKRLSKLETTLSHSTFLLCRLHHYHAPCQQALMSHLSTDIDRC